MTGTATKLAVRPLSPVLGVEITGVDLREEPDAATRAAILEAWARHHMLVLPDQMLGDGDQIRFCEIFAPVQPERLSPHLVDRKKPGVHYVANTRPDAILPDGEIIWHSDQPFYELPSQATTLYAIEVPSSGGETSFANCHLAYDALPPEIKRRLEGLRALNAYYYESPNRLRKTTAVREPEAPRAVQPVIRTHPLTGRKSIYVNRLMTDYILDIDPAESNEILNELFDLIEQPRFQYQHRWRVGDLVIWDNRCLLHMRNSYDHINERRTLRRITIAGDRPY
jgi:taurine dioxygenase